MTTAVRETSPGYEVLAGPGEARARAERIRTAADDLGSLLLEAQQREDWRALGYDSWRAYLETEFAIGIRRVNQLLTQGRVNRELAAAGSSLKVSAREAVAIVKTAKGNAFPAQIEQQVLERRAQAKPKGRKRGLPDKSQAMNAISIAIEYLFAKMDSYEDEEIAASLTHDERRALERAALRATDLADRAARILTLDVPQGDF